MKILFDIRKIIVMTRSNGTDKVSFITNIQSPFPIDVGSDTLILDFEVQKGRGIQYIKNNFMHTYEHLKSPILEHIDLNTGEHRIIT